MVVLNWYGTLSFWDQPVTHVAMLQPRILLRFKEVLLIHQL